VDKPSRPGAIAPGRASRQEERRPRPRLPGGTPSAHRAADLGPLPFLLWGSTSGQRFDLIVHSWGSRFRRSAVPTRHAGRLPAAAARSAGPDLAWTRSGQIIRSAARCSGCAGQAQLELVKCPSKCLFACGRSADRGRRTALRALRRNSAREPSLRPRATEGLHRLKYSRQPPLLSKSAEGEQLSRGQRSCRRRPLRARLKRWASSGRSLNLLEPQADRAL